MRGSKNGYIVDMNTFHPKDKKVSQEDTFNTSGWVRNKPLDCPFCLNLWICSICIRSNSGSGWSWDLRYLFCPIGKKCDDDREDLQ